MRHLFVSVAFIFAQATPPGTASGPVTHLATAALAHYGKQAEDSSMSRIFKNTVVATAVIATMLGVSAGAWADGGRHHGGGQGHYAYERGHHHKQRPVHKGYYRGYPRSYAGRYKHRHNDDDDQENLLIGLLMGGLVGYAMGSHQQSYDYGAGSYPPATIQPQASYPAPQPGFGSGPSNCLQEREYQTKVIVGGKQVDAYGTACLQPDGSWRRGPAQLVSY
jgi:hypothetical protein